MVLAKLLIKPGMRVVESGTGTGSLSVSFARMLIPSGRLFTFEFNQDRAEKAVEDFQQLRLSETITVTHRDVIENGFLLESEVQENSIDAVFLDLPAPVKAVTHAQKVLKSKGRICNFSPCIEQVQGATMQLAREGFYDIRTFECLSRELNVTKKHFISLENASNSDSKTNQEEESKEEPGNGKLLGKRMHETVKMPVASPKVL